MSAQQFPALLRVLPGPGRRDIAGLSLASQLFAGLRMTAVTLLLLALLKNSEFRAEQAIQRKLDAHCRSAARSAEGRAGEGP
ncbi:hypothetical protein ACFYRC_32855 [Streptomyces sp. NPDC005279]|uniref:hypothetical protein n=1 Tax=Streptomyces sp. NPDC005279 TaxID=3364712 RepID=UPI00369BE8D9